MHTNPQSKYAPEHSDNAAALAYRLVISNGGRNEHSRRSGTGRWSQDAQLIKRAVKAVS
jgi:hypothetical protein